MIPWGKAVAGPPGWKGQVAMCLFLAIGFALGGDRLTGIERVFYDYSQRLSAGASQAPVVIVRPDDPTGDPWAAPRLGELLARLDAAGARAILPATPPPPPVRQADIGRLETLIRLEERSGNLPRGLAPGELRRQLAEAEGRVTRQQEVAAAVREAGNVVLGLGTVVRHDDATQATSACASRVAAASDHFTAAAQEHPALASLAPTSAGLCQAAAAVAQVALLTDRDGIVRQAAPVLLTPPGAVPSMALAALELGGRTEAAIGRLTRYYRSNTGSAGFPVVSGKDVLTGAAAATIKGRYVVLGNPAAGPAGSIRTPLDETVGPAAFIATDLANYLQRDHIVRPGWAIWVELATAVLLAAAVFLVAGLGLGQVAILAASAMALLLLADYLLLAVAGLWIHLAGLAVFCIVGVMLLRILSRFTGAGSQQPMAMTGDSALASGPTAELDLGFSVLRQQPTTDRTKQKLYALAMEHGKKRDYAKAERVFRHLAARDPGYRDVAEKLEKLSGARGVVAARQPKSGPPAPKPAPAPSAPAAGKTTADQSLGGQSLGRYELERVIGRGAMATVYLGRDPTINRRVAIKTMPLAEEFAESDLATARSHFLREAESAGRLNHPNIISIYDAGEDDRVAYLAMEYFQGKPLSHYAQLGRLLPPRTVVELMARAADALQYAHSQNVVHRDVKPANLMYDIDTDQLKLTDFGIARLTDSSRTRTGIILGTPSYMSPEQLSASKVTGQTDLYSLGVTMYHLLTGAPPFQADSIPRLMDKIVSHKHRPVADIRDDVPPAIDVILSRALAKDPADRYESGKAMAFALRECCSTFASEIV